MANFAFEPTQGNGFFRMGARPSILANGVEFTFTQVVTGVWKDSNGNILNKEGANSIIFCTSLSNDTEDAIGINRLLKKRLVYDSTGRAKILHFFEEHNELISFMENKIGRDANDSSVLNGTAKEVGERILKEFFADKKLVCKEHTNVFFKEIKDGEEKLTIPINPIITISFKE